MKPVKVGGWYDIPADERSIRFAIPLVFARFHPQEQPDSSFIFPERVVSDVDGQPTFSGSLRLGPRQLSNGEGTRITLHMQMEYPAMSFLFMDSALMRNLEQKVMPKLLTDMTSEFVAKSREIQKTGLVSWTIVGEKVLPLPPATLRKRLGQLLRAHPDKDGDLVQSRRLAEGRVRHEFAVTQAESGSLLSASTRMDIPVNNPAAAYALDVFTEVDKSVGVIFEELVGRLLAPPVAEPRAPSLGEGLNG